MSFPENIHLFCRVVDNYGDIGVCWRLARQLAAEFSRDVTLWVDDLHSFQKICRDIDPALREQNVAGVSVKAWRDEAFLSVCPEDTGDMVIEAFACELPATYIDAMASRVRRPAWINFEYLSAESWVEGCHAMPSPHPSLPLTKYFFFPGFSERTGGLLAESCLTARRDAFQRDAGAISAFLATLGVNADGAARKLSLFCYPDAPVLALLDVLAANGEPTICLVPEGTASSAVGEFMGRAPVAGASMKRGALMLHVIPFVDQPEYDKLLWACDLNLVRGEDSFVRAQWAGRPFLWNIYPQDEGAHWTKLSAFLAQYCAGLPVPAAAALTAMNEAWNGMGQLATSWHSFILSFPDLARHAVAWADRLQRNGNLAANLIQFAEKFS